MSSECNSNTAVKKNDRKFVASSEFDIILTGNYLKFNRMISQTNFDTENKKLYNQKRLLAGSIFDCSSSIETIISKFITKLFSTDQVSFLSSGRYV